MPILRLLITVLCVFSISHGVWGQTVTLNAADDTWTHGLSSTSTEGNSPRLSICPLAGYWIYLKFDVSEIEASVLDAELRMTRFDGSRPGEISLYFIPDDDWQESSLTGQNRPAPQNPSPNDALTSGNDHGSYDSWHSTALAEAVEQEKNGDGILSSNSLFPFFSSIAQFVFTPESFGGCFFSFRVCWSPTRSCFSGMPPRRLIIFSPTPQSISSFVWVFFRLLSNTVFPIDSLSLPSIG